MDSNALNSLGLVFDIIGAAGLFLVGPPRGLSRVGALLLETTRQEDARNMVYDRVSYVALGLLVLGFVLQLLSNFVG